MLCANELAHDLLDTLFPESITQRAIARLAPLRANSNYESIWQLTQDTQKKMSPDWFYKPVLVDIEMTHRCSLRCRECSIIEDIEKADFGLTAPKIVELLNQANDLGIYGYSITGGEVFMRSDDLMQIISKSPVDCYKIQTNGTVFTSAKSTNSILNLLNEAGFGSKNKHLISHFRVSAGIQNYDGGAKLDSSYNVARHFYETFSFDSARLSFYLTHNSDKYPLDVISSFRRGYEEKFSNKFDATRIELGTGLVDWTPRISNEHLQYGDTTISELIHKMADRWSCFESERITMPWPRMLIRADGQVYTCTCFGHVFKVGNVLKNSLIELINNANQLPLFKLIHEKGLLGYLEYAQTIIPEIGLRKIPSTAMICQACGIIRQSLNP